MINVLNTPGFYFESEEKQNLIIRLRAILQSSSIEISEGQLFGRITYFAGKSPVAFICIKRERAYVELGFFKAVFLEDPGKLFTGKSKEIRRIKIRSVRDIPVIQIKKWIRQSLIILKSKN